MIIYYALLPTSMHTAGSSSSHLDGKHGLSTGGSQLWRCYLTFTSNFNGNSFCIVIVVYFFISVRLLYCLVIVYLLFFTVLFKCITRLLLLLLCIEYIIITIIIIIITITCKIIMYYTVVMAKWQRMRSYAGSRSVRATVL